MFDAVEEYNDVIREARVSDDPALRVKVKWRRVVNPPTMRNIQATLRHALYIGTPRPSPVMVWTPEQTRRFLDQARKHRLYPLYRLIALRGLRRGDRTTEVDLKKGTVGISWQITQLGWNPRQGKPKTDASDRTIDLDTDTIKILRHHRARQNRDRLAAGMGETEFFFTDEAGQPLHPAHVTDQFQVASLRSRAPAHPPA
jgi:integrase